VEGGSFALRAESQRVEMTFEPIDIVARQYEAENLSSAAEHKERSEQEYETIVYVITSSRANDREPRSREDRHIFGNIVQTCSKKCGQSRSLTLCSITRSGRLFETVELAFRCVVGLMSNDQGSKNVGDKNTHACLNTDYLLRME
jgi:hypothetical protein